jgi:flagellin-like protein
MRLKALLAEDDNAVSPVIGVILMVAITVILAAVIASFVLGLGPSAAAPTVNFDSDYDSSTSNLTVEVAGGDTVPVSQLSFSGDYDADWGPDNASATVDGETAIQSGDTRIINGVSTPYEINVVWTSGDGGTSQTLTTFEG